jgi:hypothetical protein
MDHILGEVVDKKIEHLLSASVPLSIPAFVEQLDLMIHPSL